MTCPFQHVDRGAQVFLMGLAAAARRSIGEVECEVARDEMQGSGARDILWECHVTSKVRFAGVVNGC